MAAPTPAKLRSCFDFLVDEFRMRPQQVRLDAWARRWTPAVCYGRDGVAVYVEYDVREAYLNVLLFASDDGSLPVRNGMVDYAKGIPLNSCVFLEAPGALILSLYELGPDTDVDAYLAAGAEKLRKYAADFLRGDFSRRTMAERATQAIAAARDGESNART